MKTQIDWQQIFTECKNNIQKNIKPCLKTLKEPQPNLGMGAGGDMMKPVDLAAETAIVDTFRSTVFPLLLISEESGIKEYGATPEECYLCVDPIDGTTNLSAWLALLRFLNSRYPINLNLPTFTLAWLLIFSTT